MAKRRTLKRRWLEEKSRREKLERLLHEPQLTIRSSPYKEPIRMALRRSYSKRALTEYDAHETPKRMMIADMLCKPLSELTETEYKAWLEIVNFEVVDVFELLEYTMTWYILPARF